MMRERSARVIEPLRFEDDVVVKGGTIGPNVTLERGAKVDGSTLRDTIVGEGARIASRELWGR